MYREAFPSRLKHARESWSFKQQFVADELKIKRSTLSCYETGKREPDLETLGALAEFYQVSIDWLLGAKGGPPPQTQEEGSKNERSPNRNQYHS